MLDEASYIERLASYTERLEETKRRTDRIDALHPHASDRVLLENCEIVSEEGLQKRVRVHEGPIRYKTESGRYAVIDQRLTPIDGSDDLECLTNTVRVVVRANGGVSIGDLTFAPSTEIKASAEKRIISNVDVGVAETTWAWPLGVVSRVTVIPGGAKEELILPLGFQERISADSKSVAFCYTYSGTGAVVVGSGIRFNNGQEFGPVVVRDAEGKRCRGEYVLDAAAMTIEVQVDAEWLRNAAYPVVIDPTSINQTTAEAVHTHSSVGKTGALWFQFDLPDMAGNTPSAASFFIRKLDTNGFYSLLTYSYTHSDVSWTSASLAATLNALQAGAYQSDSNTIATADANGTWYEFDIWGAVETSTCVAYAYNYASNPGNWTIFLWDSSQTSQNNALTSGTLDFPAYNDEENYVRLYGPAATTTTSRPYIEITYTGAPTSCTGAIELGGMGVSGTAARTIICTGAAELGSIEVAGVACKAFTATGAVDMGALEIAGVAVRVIRVGMPIPNILHLRMDDNAATPTVVDASIGAHDQTFLDPGGDPNTDAHSVPGVVGTALSFDGVDDRITLSPGSYRQVLAANQDFSLCFWWKTDAPDPARTLHVLSNYDATVSSVLVNTYDGNMYITVRYVTGEIRYVGRSWSAGADNAWHPYVITRKGTVLSFFRDGELAVSNDHTENVLSLALSDRELTIGSAPTGSAQSPGFADDFRVYDRALAVTEIAFLYAHPNMVNLAPIEVAGAVARATEITGAVTLSAMTAAGIVACATEITGATELGAIVPAGIARVLPIKVVGDVILGTIEVAGAVLRSTEIMGAVDLGTIEVASGGIRTVTVTCGATLGSTSVAGEAIRTITGSGTVETGAVEIAGVGVRIIPSTGSVEMGAVEVEAAVLSSVVWVSSAVTLGDLEVNGAVLRSTEITGAATLLAVQVAGTVTYTSTAQAAGAVSLPAVQVSGTEAYTSTAQATGAVTLAGLHVAAVTDQLVLHKPTGAISLGALTASGAAARGTDAPGAVELPGVTVTGTTRRTHNLAGAVTLGAVEASGTVIKRESATGDVTLAPMEAEGLVRSNWNIVGAVEFGPLSASGEAARVVTIDCAAILEAMQAGGVASMTRKSSGAVTLGGMTLVARVNNEGGIEYQWYRVIDVKRGPGSGTRSAELEAVRRPVVRV